MKVPNPSRSITPGAAAAALAVVLALTAFAACSRRDDRDLRPRIDPGIELVAEWRSVDGFPLLKPPVVCPRPQNYMRCFDLRMNHNFVDVYRGGAHLEVEWGPAAADIWIIAAADEQGAEAVWRVNTAHLMEDADNYYGLGRQALLRAAEQMPDLELHLLARHYWIRLRMPNTGDKVKPAAVAMAHSVIAMLGRGAADHEAPPAPQQAEDPILGGLARSGRLRAGTLANQFLCLDEQSFYQAINGKAYYYFDHGVVQALFADALIGRPDPAWVQIYMAGDQRQAASLLDDAFLSRPRDLERDNAVIKLDLGLPANIMLAAQVDRYFMQIVIAEKNDEAEAALVDLGVELADILSGTLPTP